jgi:ornithine cyclodeaminase/alanine dehydrogenase-like protein (mu-crystallin family)
MPEFRIIGADLVHRLLPYDECIPLMRRAFLAEAEGRALQPIRQAMLMPSGKGLLSMMPGVIADPDWLGIKVITVFPGNFGTELGSHQGPILLFDPDNGCLMAMIDGREVTAIRTAAASAVATDALANPDAASLGVFGYGEQAHTHVAAIRAVRKVREVLVWGRDPARAGAFAEGLGEGVRAVATPQEAAAADILCLTTAAKEPYFEGAWLRPGQHINVVGSSIPTTSEIDHETLVGSRVFVDFRDSALALGGDLRRALEAGAITSEHILGSVGGVLSGACAGRTSAEDITLFKSLGMVAEDLISCDHILRAAEAQDVGVIANF